MTTARLWTAFLFVAGAAIALGGAYAASEAVDPVYPGMRAKMSLLRTRAAEIQVVTVGNSHSQAVDFRAMDMDGMHLWQGGQDAFEASYLGRYAAGEVPQLQYVLFAASYGLQRLDNRLLTSEDQSGRRRQMYARTSLLRPLPGDLEPWVTGKLAPVVRYDHWRGVVARPKHPRVTPSMRPDGSVQVHQGAPLTPDSLERLGARQGAGQRALAAETLAADSTTPARVEAQLDALARLLHRRGAVLVLYTPPYHHTYLRERDPAVLNEMRRLLGNVARRNPNAVWLDFASHPAFARRDDLFRDSHHTNPIGARIFSVMLRRCLAALEGSREPLSPPDGRCTPREGDVASRSRSEVPIRVRATRAAERRTDR